MTIGKKKTGTASKKKGGTDKTQGRVKNYVINELVGLAIQVLESASADLEPSELYVLLAKRYRKLNDDLFNQTLDRLMGDKRISYNPENKTFRHRSSMLRDGIVMVAAQSLPVVVDNQTGERYRVIQDQAGLVLPGDEVRYKTVREFSSEYSGDYDSRANIVEVVGHAISEIIGEVKTGKTNKKAQVKRHFHKLDARLCNLSVALLDNEQTLEAYSDKKVIARIEHYPDKDDPKVGVLIDRELIVENDAQLEIELAVRQFNLPHEFSDQTIAETEKLPDKVLARDRARRVDLRDVPFCTIDGEDARDFDDAVYAQKIGASWRLLVAIADVSYYVKPESALDRDAQIRSTSVYFPRRVIPMLPEKLCNGLCSLNPAVDRCALVCDMVIDDLGTVTAYQFYPAVIHSHGRLTYTRVWNYLSQHQIETEGQRIPEELLPSLDTLYNLYKVLREARERRGAIDFATRETQVLTDESGNITSIVARVSNDAHRLIEECMLAANTCAADFIGRHNRLSLYRVHDKPSSDRLLQLRQLLSGFGLTLQGGNAPTAADYEAVVEAVKGKPYNEAVQMALLRSMQRAVYSPDNIGHYGLGYDFYTHFTSPIRRYPDLLVHRTIRAILSRRTYRPLVYIEAGQVLEGYNGKSLERTLSAMPQSTRSAPHEPSYGDWVTLGKITSACERRADDASRDVVAWLKCRYMSELAKQRKYFTARINTVTQFGIFVELLDNYIEGFVHVSNLGFDYFDYTADGTLVGRDFGDIYRVGQIVKVKLIGIDEDRRRIDFRIT